MSNKIKNKSETRSKTKILELQYPIEWGEAGLVSRIEFSRPKGKHLKHIGKDVDMSTIINIACKVSGYTPAFFDELDGQDFFAVSEVITDFLDTGLTTGRTV